MTEKGKMPGDWKNLSPDERTLKAEMVNRGALHIQGAALAALLAVTSKPGLIEAHILGEVRRIREKYPVDREDGWLNEDFVASVETHAESLIRVLRMNPNQNQAPGHG